MSRSRPSRDLSKDPSNWVPLSEREASFSPRVACCFQLLLPCPPPSPKWPDVFLASSFQTLRPQRMRPPSLRWKPKKGPGGTKTRLDGEDLQVPRRPPLPAFASTSSIFSTLRLTSCKESVRFTEALTSLPSRDARCRKKKKNYDSRRIESCDGGLLSSWPETWVG